MPCLMTPQTGSLAEVRRPHLPKRDLRRLPFAGLQISRRRNREYQNTRLGLQGGNEMPICAQPKPNHRGPGLS